MGQRKAIVVAMDWTDFDPDNQATLVLSLITRHGRATPLLWLTVDKDELKDQRNDFEDLCLTRLKAILPEGVSACGTLRAGCRGRSASQGQRRRNWESSRTRSPPHSRRHGKRMGQFRRPRHAIGRSLSEACETPWKKGWIASLVTPPSWPGL